MKTHPGYLVLTTLLLAPIPVLLAQPAFDCGSNGSAGALAPTENTTLTLPPDGIFHFTTVDIPAGVTVSFIRNAANTPVYFLAQGNVTINGMISIKGTPGSPSAGGEGGPGGFDGGNGASAFPGGTMAGSGKGPGGGAAGYPNGTANSPLVQPGVYAEAAFGEPPGARTYGNPLLLPLLGGSGGGGVEYDSSGAGNGRGGGGGGGGAILIASNTMINCHGQIDFSGGQGYDSNYQNAGSSGAIRLLAPVLQGTPNVLAGNYPGRIRFDGYDFTQLNTQYFGHPFTKGANMLVFPPHPLTVRISKIAGEIIPAQPAHPVYQLLPPGTPPLVPVEITVEGTLPPLVTKIPVNIVLTPHTGARSVTALSLDAPLPSTTTVEIEFPSGVETRVDVWTQ